MSYQSTILADSPYAYWRLGDASGTTAADASGNGRAGTYNGGYTLGQTGALAGDADTAVLLDGSTGYVSATAALLSAYPLTLEAWFKTSATSGTVVGICRATGAGGGGRKLIYLSGGKVSLYAENDSLGAVFIGSQPYAANTWTHAAAVFQSGDFRLYVNGVQTDTDATALTFGTPTRLQAGVDSDVGNFLAGSVDEVAVYASALSATRILAHYNAGVAAASTGLLLKRRKAA